MTVYAHDCIFRWCNCNFNHMLNFLFHKFFFTRGQFWSSGIVVACVCVCVCPCVCQSVCHSLACPRDNWGPVQARITKFGPKMQKTLVVVPVFFTVSTLCTYIDLDSQGFFGVSRRPCFMLPFYHTRWMWYNPIVNIVLMIFVSPFPCCKNP